MQIALRRIRLKTLLAHIERICNFFLFIYQTYNKTNFIKFAQKN